MPWNLSAWVFVLAMKYPTSNFQGYIFHILGEIKSYAPSVILALCSEKLFISYLIYISSGQCAKIRFLVPTRVLFRISYINFRPVLIESRTLLTDLVLTINFVGIAEFVINLHFHLFCVQGCRTCFTDTKMLLLLPLLIIVRLKAGHKKVQKKRYFSTFFAWPVYHVELTRWYQVVY